MKSVARRNDIEKTAKKAKVVNEEEDKEEEVEKDDTDMQPEMTNEEMMSLITIKEDKVENVTPLQVLLPMIVDWYTKEYKNMNMHMVVRADHSYERFTSFVKMLKKFTRDDLDNMYAVSQRKYGDNQGKFAEGRIIWEALLMMYDPDKIPTAFIRAWSPVTIWQLQENCGVHYILQRDANIMYFLVEKRYKLNLNLLENMLLKKLTTGAVSEMAIELIRNITR